MEGGKTVWRQVGRGIERWAWPCILSEAWLPRRRCIAMGVRLVACGVMSRVCIPALSVSASSVRWAGVAGLWAVVQQH
jgi:hypothetical protein